MAHRRKSRDSVDTNDITSDELLSPAPVTFPALTEPNFFEDFSTPNLLTEVQDGRSYNPSPMGDALSVVGTGAPTTKISQTERRLPTQVSFNKPQSSIVCARRQQRREVIFAKKYHRRRGGGGGRKRDFWSQFKC